MVLAYDNWERLVEATLKREELWQLCHQPSRSSSNVSTLSDFSLMSSNPEGSSSHQQNFPVTQPTLINSRESKSEKKEKSVSKVESKLVFVKGYNLAIGLQSLLQAPSTYLGKGAFGIAYMTALSNGVRVVVKRLRELSVDETEFKRQMEVTASIRHENVVPLRGYCTIKDNKLMLYDYYSHGSVHARLCEYHQLQETHTDGCTTERPAVDQLQKTSSIRLSASRNVLGNDLVCGASRVRSGQGMVNNSGNSDFEIPVYQGNFPVLLVFYLSALLLLTNCNRRAPLLKAACLRKRP